MMKKKIVALGTVSMKWLLEHNRLFFLYNRYDCVWVGWFGKNDKLSVQPPNISGFVHHCWMPAGLRIYLVKMTVFVPL
jgi:hypothetical protein